MQKTQKQTRRNRKVLQHFKHQSEQIDSHLHLELAFKDFKVQNVRI